VVKHRFVCGVVYLFLLLHNSCCSLWNISTAVNADIICKAFLLIMTMSPLYFYSSNDRASLFASLHKQFFCSFTFSYYDEQYCYFRSLSVLLCVASPIDCLAVSLDVDIELEWNRTLVLTPCRLWHFACFFFAASVPIFFYNALCIYGRRQHWIPA